MESDITTPEVYFACIGHHRLGWGSTPRAALRMFWREIWRMALEGARVRNPEHWLTRECMRLVYEAQPLNWYRAVSAQDYRQRVIDDPDAR